ncbi:hypothetical protein L7F22_060497 [Adiantum nelumboides]|nr:hypothetical protein [Adiantum nelumboides]
MLLQASLPDAYWEEATAIVCYIQNRIPSTRNPTTTPYTLWHGHPPHLGHLRIFGSIAYPLVTQPLSKLSPRAQRTIFVGYGDRFGIKAYRLYIQDHHKFIFAHTVVFDEEFILSGKSSPPVHTTFSSPPSSVHSSHQSSLAASPTHTSMQNSYPSGHNFEPPLSIRRLSFITHPPPHARRSHAQPIGNSPTPPLAPMPLQLTPLPTPTATTSITPQTLSTPLSSLPLICRPRSPHSPTITSSPRQTPASSLRQSSFLLHGHSNMERALQTAHKSTTPSPLSPHPGDSKIIAAPESCPPTTIVIQKILTSIRQEDMLSLLDSFCRETNLPHQPNDSAEFEFFPKHEHPIAASMSNDIEIDYVHMPLSRKGLHKGFAVVNFTKFKAALMFNAIHHKRAVEIGAHTSFVCEVAFAAIQGVEAHLQKWRLGSTPSLNHVSQEPLLFNPPCNGFVNCLSDRLQGQKLSTLSPSTATSSSSMLSPALATDMEGDVGSGSPWHLSSSPLSLQSLPSALKANSAPTATKSCVKKEERKRGSLQGKIMNVEGVQMGSSKKRSGKDHVVAWPMNMTSMRMRGKLAAPSSNESVPRKKRKKFQKEKAKYEGSAATSTSSSLVQQTVASRLAQIEEEDKDHEDAIPLRQSFAWIYNGVLRFLWRSGLSKLSVSQIVMYVKQN